MKDQRRRAPPNPSPPYDLFSVLPCPPQLTMSQTLLTPFHGTSYSPAIILPPSAGRSQTISYSELKTHIGSFISQLDSWDGPAGPLQAGDTVSMSLVNGAEFVVSFLGVGGHRSVGAPLGHSRGWRLTMWWS
jgi:acyl-CoA synthetase (AMP-forming)/AMP-acid ligase II